ncbi:MAG: ATP-dependent helicase [Salinispira sp.]
MVLETPGTGGSSADAGSPGTPQLNPEQREAVGAHNGALLIVAGAGSGKTRVITRRIISMLEAGISQSAILALTFTNKAGREMAERVAQAAGRKLPRLTIATFHSFGLRILKRHITRLGWRTTFSIYDSADQKKLIRNCAREINWNPETLNINHAAHIFSTIKSGRRRWEDDGIDITLKPLYEEYQNNLRLYNALDFDDLIRMPIELFTNYPDVLDEYHQQYRYLMIDEFQDTSMQQYELMRLLTEKSRNVCVVGDDDQSIYSWRGANFSNLQNFESDFPERREIKLEQNYRSTASILDAANHLIQNNTKRKKKQLWTERRSGVPIELYRPDDERMEAQWISDFIQTARLREGVSYHDIAVLIRTNHLARPLEEEFMARRIPYQLSGGSSFFERAEIKDIIAYLRCISNPNDDISLLRIINTPRRGIGKRSLEVLRAAADGSIAVDVNAAANSAAAGNNAAAGNVSVDGSANGVADGAAKQQNLYHAMKELVKIGGSPHSGGSPQSGGSPSITGAALGARAMADLEDFVRLIDTFRPRLLREHNFAGVLRDLLTEVDYWGYVLNEFQNREDIAEFRRKNIEIFISSLERWEQHPDNRESSIFDYLNRITLAGRENESEDGKVNLMTIHAAKGLEFDIVFIAGVEENIIPHKRSLEESGNSEEVLEEERRIFYVALTRAKKKLCLTHCSSRYVLRELIDMNPSPFLEEIPDQFIHFKEPEDEVTEDEAKNYFALMKSRFTGD